MRIFHFHVFQLSPDRWAVFNRIGKSKSPIEYTSLHARIAGQVFYFGTQPFYFVRATP